MSNSDSESGAGKSRIHIKLGSLEIEFEGSEAFLENHLPNLVELLGSIEPPLPENGEPDEVEAELLEASGDKSKQELDMSTSMIANKLDAARGRDLVIAACAHLHLVKGHEQYSRSNILAEMQTAKSYYRSTYSNNLTGTLKRCVKAGELNELTENTFSLHETMLKQLKGKLGA